MHEIIERRDREIERLKVERDEIAASKDKLCCQLHRIIGERDQEIKSLKAEKETLNHAHENVDDLQNSDPDRASAEAEERSYTFEWQGDNANHPQHASAAFGSAEALRVSNLMQQLTFIPLVQVNDEGVYEVDNINKVATPVKLSIHSIMAEAECRHALENKPQYPPGKAHPCAWVWMHNGMPRWTVESWKQYACFSCFQSRRACLLWIGKMTWLLLPLPPAVRDQHVTWLESNYYIYGGTEKKSAFSRVWMSARA